MARKVNTRLGTKSKQTVETDRVWGVWVRHAVYGDRKWTAGDIVEIETKAGAKMVVRMWKSRCVICLAAYEVPTSLSRSPWASRSLNTVTCEKHRMSKSDIASIANAQSIEDKKCAFSDIKRKKQAADKRARAEALIASSLLVACASCGRKAHVATLFSDGTCVDCGSRARAAASSQSVFA